MTDTTKKRNQPPMAWRPVYVEYVSVRRCRRNPSAQRMAELPSEHQSTLWDRWKKRHPTRPVPRYGMPRFLPEEKAG